jgi:GT2 family glycosyltransferase
MLTSLCAADAMPYELIVVDNNSHDDTRQVCGEMRGRFGPAVRYIFEGEKGLSHARNRGIREASGDIIAFTDDDVRVDAGWLQNIAKAFDEYPDAACVGGKILPMWEIPRPEWLSPRLYNWLGLLDYGEEARYMDSTDIWGANFAVRSDIFKRYGPFDTNLGRIPGKLYGGEETELLMRLRKAGEKIIYYPSAVVHHMVPAGRMTKRYFRRWNYDHGELTGILRHDPIYQEVFGSRCLTWRRMFMSAILNAAKAVPCAKNGFLHELRLCYIAGWICGNIKRPSVPR